ncbi:MAG TPA: hypothetical protein VLQ48_00345 [Chloroflexia bacterium]|nr:hypothetical protein [Chloroflexia bacterium]
MAVLAVGVLSACTDPTTVDYPASSGNYNVTVSMDPQRLNPPQIATINYHVTDASNGKPVTNFSPVEGALFHNVLISGDLTQFKHSYSDKVADNQVSLLTFFPQRGSYYSFALFQPQGGDMQLFPGTVHTGEGAEPDLKVDSTVAKVTAQYGLRVELMTGTEPIKAGQDTQMAVYVSERGVPVNAIWPYLDAPGYMWTISSEGKDFSWEKGSAVAHQLLPEASATASTGGAQSSTSPTPAAAATGTPAEPTVGPPTLVPGIDSELATRTVQPIATLQPAQATAQSSILEPSLVLPEVGYGPYIAFTHNFPEAGLYKIWVEFSYRNHVVLTDWVVQVDQ